MTYEQIIQEILSFARKQQLLHSDDQYAVQLSLLYQHFHLKFPDLDKRSVAEVIEEIDARGWLLNRSDTILVFDPAAFEIEQ
jgi:hypothetical protein